MYQQMYKRMVYSMIGMMLGCIPAAIAKSASIQMTIGTGSVTGVYYPVGGTICQLVNSTQTDQMCAVESTGGSVENIKLLSKKELQLAVVQYSVLQQAILGIGDFASAPVSNVYPVLSLYAEPLNLVVSADSDIFALDDIKGKRVDIGNPGSGDRNTVSALFHSLNWSNKDFSTLTGYKAAERSDALCSGKIDSFFIVAAHPNQVIREAIGKCNAKLVPIEGEEASVFLAHNPFYSKQVIPAATYRLRDDKINTVGTTAILATHTEVALADLNALKTAIQTNLGRLKAMHPALSSLQWEKMSPPSDTVIAPKN
ncbi:MAG: TAXI family TRAP transporter solute-binding subunit [Aeromonas veronii]